MRTTIDAAGRVVIPKAIRDPLGLAGGSEIEIEERDGRIEIHPVTALVRLVEKDGIWVAATEENVPPLTDAAVRETLERLRDRG